MVASVAIDFEPIKVGSLVSTKDLRLVSVKIESLCLAFLLSLGNLVRPNINSCETSPGFLSLLAKAYFKN